MIKFIVRYKSAAYNYFELSKRIGILVLRFYLFPREHWRRRIRTTNIIERVMPEADSPRANLQGVREEDQADVQLVPKADAPLAHLLLRNAV